MHHTLISICLLSILLRAVSSITAQGNILIHDSLGFHAEALDVNFEYPVSENLKFYMGGYTILIDNKLSDIYNATNAGFFEESEVNRTIKTISFTIRDSALNMAMVTIVEKNKVNSYNNVDIGIMSLNMSSSNKFVRAKTSITIRGNSSEIWTLNVKKRNGDEWTPPVEMLLANGKKSINLINVSSDAQFAYSRPLRSLKKMPSMGVEFFQNGKSVCALQYDSGAPNNFDMGPRQSFGCKAWMLNDLDAKTKLMLAATMATLILSNNPYLRIMEIY